MYLDTEERWSSASRAPAAIGPGKRTMTMSLPPHAGAAAAPVQLRRRPDAADAGDASGQAALTRQLLDAAVRPDLALATVQRQRDAAEDALPSSPSSSSTGGEPLPADVRAKMERSFAADFSAVRIHEGPAAVAIGALAYTKGTDLHFAPGQYAPHTEKGQELLGHELAHTLQQAQGRVAAPGQAKGGINADVALEREADEMGVRAARGELVSDGGGDAGDATATQHRPSSGSQTIQRKVGFEFETDVTVSRGGHALVKTDRIGTAAYDGFKVESDDDGRLEIIIHPPIEITPNLQTRLNTIFAGIEAYCLGLQNAAQANRTEVQEEVDEEAAQQNVLDEDLMREEDGENSQVSSDSEPSEPEEPEEPEYDYQTFTLDAATGVPGDSAFTVLPRRDVVAGNPQLTTGLSLEQIANLGTYNEEQPLPNGVAEAITSTPAQFVPRVNREACLRAGIDFDKDLRGEISDEMKGMLTMVASYLVGGTTPYIEYPKIITDRFMLSRTQLSTVIKEMSEWRYFARNPGQWVALALDVANVNDGAQTPVYVHGVIVNAQVSVENRAPFGPTRDAWLRGLLADTDLLSASQDARFEGMGALGTKRENVGTRDGESLISGGIFEMRGGQTTSRVYTEWRGYASAAAQFLQNMQRDPSGHLGAMERNQQRRDLL
jgi:hypothetical protein